MNWTKEPPTEPGWYWWRAGDDLPKLRALEIQRRAADRVLIVRLCRSAPRADAIDGEWLPERIQEPPQ